MAADSATPGIGRRLLCLVYELLLLIAVLLLAGAMATALAQSSPGYSRIITQGFVLAACCGYFAWQWHRSGQTLPMKTWRIRLETASGGKVSLPRALLRTLLSAAGYGTGLSLIWVFFDRDRQFLHDRLAGTRLVLAG